MNEHNLIRFWREKAGLTRAEVAAMVGVSENTIANWERGGAAKWINHIYMLCRALGVNLEDLTRELLEDEALPSIDSESQGAPKLTSNMIRSLKKYCDAKLSSSLSGNDNLRKQITLITSYAMMNDDSLRYWLKIADKLIDCHKGSHDPLNSNIVVNLLILQNLDETLRQISPTSPNSVLKEDFERLVNNINLSNSFVNKYVEYNGHHFSRRLIIQSRLLAVYVISWNPGQACTVHHHGSSLDAIRVIQGEMTHWSFGPDVLTPFESARKDDEKYDKKFLKDQRCKSQKVQQGELVIVDRGESHKIANNSEKRLVTLNIRFGAPPDDQDRNWNRSNKNSKMCNLKESYRIDWPLST